MSKNRLQERVWHQMISQWNWLTSDYPLLQHLEPDTLRGPWIGATPIQQAVVHGPQCSVSRAEEPWDLSSKSVYSPHFGHTHGARKWLCDCFEWLEIVLILTHIKGGMWALTVSSLFLTVTWMGVSMVTSWYDNSLPMGFRCTWPTIQIPALVSQQRRRKRKMTSLKSHLLSILPSSPVCLHLWSAWLTQLIPVSSSLSPAQWRRAGLSPLPHVSPQVD